MQFEIKIFSLLFSYLLQSSVVDAHVLLPRAVACPTVNIHNKINDIIAPQNGYDHNTLIGIKVEDADIPHLSVIFLLNKVDKVPAQLQRLVQSFNAANGKYGCAQVVMTGGILKYLPHTATNMMVEKDLYDALLGTAKCQRSVREGLLTFCSAAQLTLNWQNTQFAGAIWENIKTAATNWNTYPRYVCYVGTQDLACVSWSSDLQGRVTEAEAVKAAKACLEGCDLNKQSCKVKQVFGNKNLYFCVSNRPGACSRSDPC